MLRPEIYNCIMSESSANFSDDVLDEFSRRLRIKFTNLLINNDYCTLCFSSEAVFFCLDDEITGNWKTQQGLSLRSVLKYLFGDQFESFTNQVCLECKEGATHAYNFISKTKTTRYIMNRYVDCTKSRLKAIGSQVFSNEIADYENIVIILEGAKAPNSNATVNNEKFKIKKIKIEYNEENKYNCDNCSLEFNDKHLISEHLKNCIKIENQKDKVPKIMISHCNFCNSNECKHKKYLQTYKKHKLNEKKTIQCRDCDYECGISKPVFIKHVNKVHLNMITDICEICAKSFYCRKEYRDHIRVYHVETFTCHYCERNLINNKALQEHYIVCAKTERGHKCTYCPASFDKYSDLLQHNKKHQPKIPCKTCGRLFSKLSNLKIHQNIHKSNVCFKKYKYTCAVCSINFLSHSFRSKHIRDVHTSDLKPKCLPCQKEFKTINLYKKHVTSQQHLLKINPESSKKHKCSQCSYATSLAAALEAHTNRHHLKMAPYCCKICQKRFTVSLKLDIHMRTHLDDKKFQCETCGRYLRSKITLKKHLRLHTGERPYPCDLCPEKFTNSSQRSIHKIKKHTKKKIKCPLCNLMFHILPNMRTHFKLQHWKREGEKFDVTKVEGLKEEDYELFRDRRMVYIEEENKDCKGDLK